NEKTSVQFFGFPSRRRHTRPRPCKHCAASAPKRNCSGSSQLLSGADVLGFGQKLLEFWVVPNRVPYGVNLQAGNRDARRYREQMPKSLDCFLRSISPSLDFG